MTEQAESAVGGRSGAALIAGALAACLIVPSAGYFIAGFLAARQSGDLSEEAVARRIQPLAQVELAGPVAATAKKTAEQIYQGICAACHEAGVAGAPKRGDKAAWAPRLAAGLDGLAASAIKGKGAMPPKGGDTSIADADIRAVVAYMTGAGK